MGAVVVLRPGLCGHADKGHERDGQCAKGRCKGSIAEARTALAAWLAGEGAKPDWPGIELVEPALGYPARHDAIMLAWDAALVALG